MKTSLFSRIEFWVFIVIGFTLAFLGFYKLIYASGTSFIFSQGTIANTSEYKNTSTGYCATSTQITLASSTIPSPTVPFLLDRIYFNVYSFVGGAQQFSIKKNNDEFSSYRYSTYSSGSGTSTVRYIDFSDLGLTLHPLDTYQIRLSFVSTACDGGGTTILYSTNVGGASFSNPNVGGYLGDYSSDGVYFGWWGAPSTLFSINLLYPTASSTVNDFPLWQLNAQATSNAYVRILYYPITNTQFFLPSYYDEQYYGSIVLQGGTFSVVKTHSLLNSSLTTSTIWEAIPTLNDPTSGETIYGDAVYFTADRNATSSFPSILENTSSTNVFALETCPEFNLSSSTLSSIYCNVLNAGKTAINSASGVVSSMFSTLGNLIIRIFPINILYHINSAFGVSSVATSTSNIVLNPSHSSSVFGGRSYAILTSSTMTDIKNNWGFDFKTFADYALYAGTGIIIILQTVMVIAHLKKEKQNNV